MILRLTLHRQWFDAIAEGTKTEEYREVKYYWNKRFLTEYGEFKEFDEIHFTNGYGPTRPFMRVEWRGCRLGKHEGKSVYIISLGDILEIKNWKGK